MYSIYSSAYIANIDTNNENNTENANIPEECGENIAGVMMGVTII